MAKWLTARETETWCMMTSPFFFLLLPHLHQSFHVCSQVSQMHASIQEAWDGDLSSFTRSQAIQRQDILEWLRIGLRELLKSLPSKNFRLVRCFSTIVYYINTANVLSIEITDVYLQLQSKTFAISAVICVWLITNIFVLFLK